MSREANLWKWLRSSLPKGHYSRIESETSAGFPDINYCIQGVEGNLELKVARHAHSKYPFKKGGLRRTQIIWMEDRVENRGRVNLIIQVKNTLYCFHIVDKRAWGLSLNSMTLEQIQKTADRTIIKRRKVTLKNRFLRFLT